MKLKLDENLGNRGMAVLAASGHDVTTIVLQKLAAFGNFRKPIPRPINPRPQAVGLMEPDGLKPHATDTVSRRDTYRYLTLDPVFSAIYPKFSCYQGDQKSSLAEIAATTRNKGLPPYLPYGKFNWKNTCLAASPSGTDSYCK